MADDITTKILIEIRDEIRSTNGRLDDTNSRLDETNSRLGELTADMNRRLTIATALIRGIDTHMSKIENAMTFLPRRVDVLEQKVARIEDELELDKE